MGQATGAKVDVHPIAREPAVRESIKTTEAHLVPLEGADPVPRASVSQHRFPVLASAREEISICRDGAVASTKEQKTHNEQSDAVGSAQLSLACRKRYPQPPSRFPSLPRRWTGPEGLNLRLLHFRRRHLALLLT